MSTAPALPASDRVRVATWSDESRPLPFLTVHVDTALYEDEAFADRVAPILAAETRSPRSVFTSRVSFSPPLAASGLPGAVVDLASTHAGRELATSLSDDGLVDVAVVRRGEVARREGGTIRTTEYRAGYPLDAAAVFGEAAAEETGEDGREGGPTLRLGVLAGLWPAGDSFALAGGLFPLEDLDAVAARTGRALATDVRLAADPDADRGDLRALIRRVAAQ